jgi:hypothetical protein
MILRPGEINLVKMPTMDTVKGKHYKKRVPEIKKAPAIHLTENKKLMNPSFGFTPIGLKNKALVLETLPIKVHKSDKALSDDGNKYERKASMVSSAVMEEKEKRLQDSSDED